MKVDIEHDGGAYQVRLDRTGFSYIRATIYKQRTGWFGRFVKWKRLGVAESAKSLRVVAASKMAPEDLELYCLLAVEEFFRFTKAVKELGV